VSVGVTIYRRRNAAFAAVPVGHVVSDDDLESCVDELTDVEQGLERHLENFHDLFAHYDAAEAQRWWEDRSFWLGQWQAAGERCSFSLPRLGKHAKEWEELATLHDDLRQTEEAYTKVLVHFGESQAPRLGRIRERLEKVGQRLHVPSRAESDDKTQTNASKDSGEIP
jgi:hypothetical protein